MHASINTNFYYPHHHPFGEYFAIHPVFEKSLWIFGAMEGIIKWKNTRIYTS
jgi:hypothetical protein